MSEPRTDWDRYYRRPNPFHAVLKRVVTRAVLGYAAVHAPRRRPLAVVEFGGGNSCFFAAFAAAFELAEYVVVDSSAAGLEALRRSAGPRPGLRLLQQDLLAAPLPAACDIALSVGLIEHFPAAERELAVRRHVEALRPGGLLILGFPTPTWLYRLVRRTAERIGRWPFPDERPLDRAEVAPLLAPACRMLHSEVLWSIGVTQAYLVARKHSEDGRT